MTYAIRKATHSDIQLMLSWAKEEGWNPGLSDDFSFQSADPSGFFISLLDHEPIASISAVNYSPNFGFIGLYIVKPEFRKQGHGIKIWKHGLNYLHDVATLGLDGVIEQQENYKKSGFILAHRNRRYTGRAPAQSPAAQLIDLKGVSPVQISKLDRQCFPARRTHFLQHWIKYATSALAYVKDGHVLGFGVLRKCHEGYKIGPLFADDLRIAEQLFLGLCSKVPKAFVSLDVPEPNQHAIYLAEHYRLEPVFETARMYTNTSLELNLKKMFGITSFELG